jgi:copper(I)-binding protein
MRLFLVSLLLLVFPLQVYAHEFFLGDLQIIHPSIPGTPEGATKASVYMALSNEGAEDERLLGIETPFGIVRFQRPVAGPDGSTLMEELAWIDIPAGEIVLLARGQLRGRVSNVNRPLVEGGELTGTMIFEKRGRFDMFFMLDPMEVDEATVVPESRNAKDQTGSVPAQEIPAIVRALRDTLGRGDAMIAPITAADDVAIAGWHSGDQSALAFLRKDSSGQWVVRLWSNDSLLLPATLTSLGLPAATSTRLRDEMNARLDAMGSLYRKRVEAFPGTAHVTVAAQ